MKILVAPDKFKGSLTAIEAAEAISRGLVVSFPGAQIVRVPIADGGEGTMALVSEILGAEMVGVRVSGPMGDSLTARYGMAGGRAVLEMSAASGLLLVPQERREPWAATTYGTGEMIMDALRLGAQEIIIGIGGSATNDGGVGMAKALGYQFRSDAEGALLQILPPRVRPADLAQFVVACDVANPLLGVGGCTRVFGPQKGIRPQDFERHEKRLSDLARRVASDVSQVSPGQAGAGAAGGLGFGLLAFCDAELRSGFDLVAELTGLGEAVASADLVITGEGSMDAQTLMGKGPAGVADLANSARKPVLAFCGVSEDRDLLLKRFDEVFSLQDLAESPEDSMLRAAELLEKSAAAIRN